MYLILLLFLSMPVLGLDASKRGQNNLLQAGRCFLDVQVVPKVKGSRELYRTVFFHIHFRYRAKSCSLLLTVNT